jgi:proteasome lid subunit RPN8/RPN11
MIKVRREHLEEIKRHGEEAYPNECCGFLLGESLEGGNVLTKVYRAENERRDSRHNRYLITPDQYRRADAFARERKLGIIGYYHSHPDHPAAPSGYDLDHSCWPAESYLIVSVMNGKAVDINSFSKPDYTKFEPEEILVDE